MKKTTTHKKKVGRPTKLQRKKWEKSNSRTLRSTTKSDVVQAQEVEESKKTTKKGVSKKGKKKQEEEEEKKKEDTKKGTSVKWKRKQCKEDDDWEQLDKLLEWVEQSKGKKTKKQQLKKKKDEKEYKESESEEERKQQPGKRQGKETKIDEEFDKLATKKQKLVQLQFDDIDKFTTHLSPSKWVDMVDKLNEI